MTKHLGRCEKGKKCYKTVHFKKKIKVFFLKSRMQIKKQSFLIYIVHKYPFVKFNFVCAIKYGKIIGYKLYEKDKVINKNS